MSAYRGQRALWALSGLLAHAHHLRTRLGRHRHQPAKEATRDH